MFSRVRLELVEGLLEDYRMWGYERVLSFLFIDGKWMTDGCDGRNIGFCESLECYISMKSGVYISQGNYCLCLPPISESQ